MKKKYDEKRKRVVGCHRQPEGWRGKIRLTVLLASVLHYRKGLRVAVVDCDSPQHSIA